MVKEYFSFSSFLFCFYLLFTLPLYMTYTLRDLENNSWVRCLSRELESFGQTPVKESPSWICVHSAGPQLDTAQDKIQGQIYTAPGLRLESLTLSELNSGRRGGRRNDRPFLFSFYRNIKRRSRSFELWCSWLRKKVECITVKSDISPTFSKEIS